MKSKSFTSSRNKILKACKIALTNMRMEDIHLNNSVGVITATQPSNLLSWGNEIKIEVTQETNSKTKVVVNSYSKAQLIDWGKNDENEKNIINKLAEIISE